MRKFSVLLKKEIRELLTLQMILPMIIGMLFFVFIGNVVGKETQKAHSQQIIAVLDNDGSQTSAGLKGVLEKSGFSVTIYSGISVEQAISNAESQGIRTMLAVPAGFEKGIEQNKIQEIGIYNLIKGFSVFATSGGNVAKGAVAAINEDVSNRIIMDKTGITDTAPVKNPVSSKDYAVIGKVTAAVNPDVLSSFIMSQTTFLPIVIFIVIIFASQMIVVTVASEKENKTLETMLSSPVSRISLVLSKMSAAGIVSLLMAIVYMFGFKYYMDGVTGAAARTASSQQMAEVIEKLGLNIDTAGYVLVGISLFLSILIALSISLILGVFADDVKKAQGLVAPIIFIIMIPYLLTMFIDMSTASPILKAFLYIIPFTHTFIATSSLFLHNYTGVMFGIGYQAAVLAVFIYISARIFSTDRVLTMKINFKKGAYPSVPPHKSP